MRALALAALVLAASANALFVGTRVAGAVASDLARVAAALQVSQQAQP